MVFEMLEQVDDVAWAGVVKIATVIAAIHLLMIGGQYLVNPADSLLGQTLAQLGLHASGLALSLGGVVTLLVMLVGLVLGLIGLGLLFYFLKGIFE